MDAEVARREVISGSQALQARRRVKGSDAEAFAADAALLQAFVASFATSNELLEAADCIPAELRSLQASQLDDYFVSWEPQVWATSQSACRELEARLPAPLPPLFRQLILRYRYLRVELGQFCLLANPPGPGLAGLEQEMFRDDLLSHVLLRHGFIPFGQGADGNYDPVCFNLARRAADGDMQVVRLDHEEILCHERIKVQAVLAPTFRQLVEQSVVMAGGGA